MYKGSHGETFELYEEIFEALMQKNVDAVVQWLHAAQIISDSMCAVLRQVLSMLTAAACTLRQPWTQTCGTHGEHLFSEAPGNRQRPRSELPMRIPIDGTSSGASSGMPWLSWRAHTNRQVCQAEDTRRCAGVSGD